jgi:hypothetical protein
MDKYELVTLNSSGNLETVNSSDVIAANSGASEYKVVSASDVIEKIDDAEQILTGLFDKYLPSLEWSKKVAINAGNTYGKVCFKGSLFTEIPDIEFSDKDTMYDFSYMFNDCAYLKIIDYSRLLKMFPNIGSKEANVGDLFGHSNNIELYKVNCKLIFNDNYCPISWCLLKKIIDMSDCDISCLHIINPYNICNDVTNILFNNNSIIRTSIFCNKFPNIPKTSLQGLIGALANNIGNTTQVLYLSKTLLTTLYGADYTTNAEWVALAKVGTDKNWTISIS